MNIIFLIFLLLPAYHAFYYDPYPYEFNNTYPLIRLLDRKQTKPIEPPTEPPVDIPPNPQMTDDEDYRGLAFIVGDLLVQFLRTGSDTAWNSLAPRLSPDFYIWACGSQKISLAGSRDYLYFMHEYYLEITKPQIQMKFREKARGDKYLHQFHLHFESASKWPRQHTRNEWRMYMRWISGSGYLVQSLTQLLDCARIPASMPYKPTEFLETIRQEISGAMHALVKKNGGANIGEFNNIAWRFAPNAQYDICDGGYISNAGALFNLMHNTFLHATNSEYLYTAKDQNPLLVRFNLKTFYGEEPYKITVMEDWTFTINMVYIYPNSRWPTWGITAVRRACPVQNGGQDKKAMGDAKVKITIEQIQNLHRSVGWDPVNAFIDNFDENISKIEVCNEGSHKRSGFKQWLYQEIGKYQSNRVLKGNIASYDPLDFTLLFEFKDNYMTVNREFKFKSRLNQGRYIFEQLIVSCHIRLG